jgi:hypothetical protein
MKKLIKTFGWSLRVISLACLLLFTVSCAADNTASDSALTAIDEIRSVLALPLSPLEFVEDGSMVNSPNGGMKVAIYQDTEGRLYSFAPETGAVVEIDARVMLLARSAGMDSEPALDLEKTVFTYAQSLVPDFEARQSTLSYEASAKGDNYFFTWYGEMRPGDTNRPFLQFGINKDGILFACYNTLNPKD